MSGRWNLRVWIWGARLTRGDDVVLGFWICDFLNALWTGFSRDSRRSYTGMIYNFRCVISSTPTFPSRGIVGRRIKIPPMAIDHGTFQCTVDQKNSPQKKSHTFFAFGTCKKGSALTTKRRRVLADSYDRLQNSQSANAVYQWSKPVVQNPERPSTD